MHPRGQYPVPFRLLAEMNFGRRNLAILERSSPFFPHVGFVFCVCVFFVFVSGKIRRNNGSVDLSCARGLNRSDGSVSLCLCIIYGICFVLLAELSNLNFERRVWVFSGSIPLCVWGEMIKMYALFFLFLLKNLLKYSFFRLNPLYLYNMYVYTKKF